MDCIFEKGQVLIENINLLRKYRMYRMSKVNLRYDTEIFEID